MSCNVMAVPITRRVADRARSGALDQLVFKGYTYRIATIAPEADVVRIAYVDAGPANTALSRGTILVIHSWPSSSYEFHKTSILLIEARARIIAPEYRGAGNSIKPLRLASQSQAPYSTGGVRTLHGDARDVKRYWSKVNGSS